MGDMRDVKFYEMERLNESEKNPKKYLSASKDILQNEIPKHCIKYIMNAIILIVALLVLIFLYQNYSVLSKVMMNQSYMIRQQIKQTNSMEDHHQLSFSRERIISHMLKSENNSKNCCPKKADRDLIKFDCYPENGASEKGCQDRGCIWQALDDQVPLDVPYCYYPENWQIYNLTQSTVVDEFVGSLQLIGKSPYGKDVQKLQMETESIDDNILRVKILDPSRKRYEPSLPAREKITKEKLTADKQYQFIADSFGNKMPGFNVQRLADNTVIFESIGVGGFMFSDQFLQLSAILPSKNIYGLGIHQTSLKLNTSWQILTFFNADQPPVEQKSLYGSHPFYLIIEDGGNCHGVLFLNSNAMDVVLQPTPAITFRTIGGIFDIYFFMGPTPEDVLKQYSKIVGKPFFPPYWSLGFHLSKFGLTTLNDTKSLWMKTRAAKIPYDTQWNDLDYMGKRSDFIYDKQKYTDLPKFIDELHVAGMHYIPLIDAGVSGTDDGGSYFPYIEGLKDDIFIKDAKTKGPFVGKVWNYNSTVWPDHTNPKTRDYYFKMMKMLHDEVAYDGAWIDMNEPSNFYDGTAQGCGKNDLDYPPYLPNVNDGLLAKKTVCMNALHYSGRHYDLHNTYGTSQAVNVNYALKKIRKNQRPFIISRSSWVGHGQYAGIWTGDIFSTWHDMKMSIPAILSSQLYQIPMVGADICGFNGNTTVSLCNRWMQLGAFYPFSRNHNSDDTVDQDPVSMGNLVVASSKRALRLRYFFLPYLYTLFYRAHTFGEPVIRPLFFEFTDDPMTYDIDTVFLWGKHMMIIPVLNDDAQKVTAYIPNGVWYNLHTRFPVFSYATNLEFETEIDIMPILIRGGAVIPAQKESLTTTDSRKNNFVLFVTLGKFEEASGELYWDDGDSIDSIETGNYRWIEFKVQNTTLMSANRKGNYNGEMKIDLIQILGVEKLVKCVLFDGTETSFDYDPNSLVLNIEFAPKDLKKDFKLSWFYDKEKCRQQLITDNVHNHNIKPKNESLKMQSSSAQTQVPISTFVLMIVALYFYN